MKKIAISKMEQLKARGGEVIRTAQIVRMPDHSEVAIDEFGRCVWLTSAEPNKIGKEAVIQEKVWLPAETAPKNGDVILANIGYPWAMIVCWNKHDGEWVYPNLQVNMINGEYSDPYFENEYAKPSELKGWQPLPELPTKQQGEN